MRSGGLHCLWSPPSVPQHDHTTHGRRPHNRILCGRLVCAVVRSAFSITAGQYKNHAPDTDQTDLIYHHAPATPNINKLHAPAALLQELNTHTPYWPRTGQYKNHAPDMLTTPASYTSTHRPHQTLTSYAYTHRRGERAFALSQPRCSTQMANEIKDVVGIGFGECWVNNKPLLTPVAARRLPTWLAYFFYFFCVFFVFR